MTSQCTSMILPSLVQCTAWQCLTSHSFRKIYICSVFGSFSVSHDGNAILKYTQIISFQYYVQDYIISDALSIKHTMPEVVVY